MRFLRLAVAFLLIFVLVIPCSALKIEKPNEPEGFQWGASKETLLAGLWEADIASIHEAYQMGWITCQDLTAYYLERIAEYNDTYNCFITLCDDAMEQAARCDEILETGEAQGALFGIPLVIKDNINYAGYYTTNGQTFRNSSIAYSNAEIVDHILQAGAIIIGKTNMSTMAEDYRASYSEAVGETKNAYSPFLASGGSSGGSAVATSLNFAVAGLGTDTNSSLRYPAVLNGCISLRATVGSFSRRGITILSSKRDVPGVITRTVKDQAIILDVLSGGKTSYSENLNEDALVGLRIGILTELSDPSASYRNRNADPEIIAAFENAIQEMESLGAECVPINISNIVALAERTLITYDYSDMEAMYAAIKHAMERNGVTVIVFPTYLSAPARTGKDQTGKLWHPFNQPSINNARVFSSCAGLPEIAIPIGYHSRGAGIGMEIAALKNQEQLLLDIAYSYTQKYDHRKPTENAPDLYAEYYKGSLSACMDSYYAAIEQYEEDQRIAAEEAARLEAERLAAEEAERLEAEKKRQELEAQQAAVREQEEAQKREALLRKQRIARIIIIGLVALAVTGTVALVLVLRCSKSSKKFS